MKLTKKNTALTAVFLVVMTLSAKVCGMLRDIALAGMYGTDTNQAIAFSTASRIPLLFFDIALGSAVTSAFIPIFNEYLEKDGRDKAIEFSNRFISLIFVVTSLMAVFGIVFSDSFINIIAGGYDEQKIVLSSQLVRILFPTIVFTGLAYCFVGILQSFGEFYIPAIISLVSNGLLIIYLVIFGDTFGVHGVAVAMLVAWAMQFVVQIPSLFKMKYKFRLDLNFKSDGIKKVCLLALPIIISTWVQPINTMVNIRLASSMEGGSAVPALDYANKLYIILVGVFTFAITNLIFPSLSRAVAKGDDKEFSVIVKQALRYVMVIITPVMIGFLLMSKPIIRLFYERGAFDVNSTELTSAALFCYSFGMLGFGISEICNKAFYAMHDGKTPMRTSMVGIGINVLLSIVFVVVFDFGYKTLAVCASIAANIIGISLVYILNRKKHILDKTDFNFGLKIIISTALMALSVFVTNYFVPADNKIISLFVPAIVGATVYFVCCIIFKVEELTDVINMIKAKTRKE